MATISTGYITDTINGIIINTSVKANSSNYSALSSRNVQYVIIHYTGNSNKDSAASNCKYFQAAGRGASAHFFVDDATIYQSVGFRDSAWAIGCSQGYKLTARNSNSVSVEMCCTEGNYTVSEKTQINAAYMVAYLCKKIGVSASGVDTYVLRHYDCVKSNKKCPLQYVNDPAQFARFKTWIKNILTTGNYNGSVAATTKVTYCGYKHGKGWGSQITGYNLSNSQGYSGSIGTTLDCFTAKLTQGTISYVAHKKGGSWGSEIHGYSTTDSKNYAGKIGVEIDAITIKAEGIVGTLKYRVYKHGKGWGNWITGYSTTDSKNYAGSIGTAIDAIQIGIE